MAIFKTVFLSFKKLKNIAMLSFKEVFDSYLKFMSAISEHGWLDVKNLPVYWVNLNKHMYRTPFAFHEQETYTFTTAFIHTGINFTTPSPDIRETHLVVLFFMNNILWTWSCKEYNCSCKHWINVYLHY